MNASVFAKLAETLSYVWLIYAHWLPFHISGGLNSVLGYVLCVFVSPHISIDMLFKAKAITKMDVKISSDNLVLESHEKCLSLFRDRW